MKKVEKQRSMEINGGHLAIAFADQNWDASRPGVAGWERYCPKTKHTLVHIFNGVSYHPEHGTGRMYICPRSTCT